MDLHGLKQLHQNNHLTKIIEFGLFDGVSNVNILDIIVYCFVTSSFASLRSLSISFCIDVRKAGIIVTSECKLCKFNNSCKEFAFSYNCCAWLLCWWAALSARILSSFWSLSAASSILILLSSSAHWLSSSSNSFLKTPKLMWSPGTQT